jgi:photosystem II stability/assembly factor-like uncharacterized protein
MVGLLRNRATKHAKLSYAFLVAITAAVIMGLVVIALAPTILGNDLEKALQKEAVLDLFNTEQKDLEAEESDLDTRTSALKADFVRQFGTGESWIAAELPEDFISRLSWVELRGQVGFAVGSQILYTTNSGQRWRASAISSPGNDPFEPADNGFALGGNQAQLFGWATGKRGKIARSGDGGRTWTVTQVYKNEDPGFAPPPVDATFNYIFFSDPKNGWAVGDRGEIAYTIDGGEHWVETGPGITSANLYYVHFDEGKGKDEGKREGVVIGSDLTVLTSMDGGLTWSDHSGELLKLVPVQELKPACLQSTYTAIPQITDLRLWGLMASFCRGNVKETLSSGNAEALSMTRSRRRPPCVATSNGCTRFGGSIGLVEPKV